MNLIMKKLYFIALLESFIHLRSISCGYVCDRSAEKPVGVEKVVFSEDWAFGLKAVVTRNGRCWLTEWMLLVRQFVMQFLRQKSRKIQFSRILTREIF